jgi:hypothetical protein
MFKLILIGIGILLGAGFLILAILQTRASQEVRNIWRSLESQPTSQHFTPDMIAELPEPVQRYFRHAIAPGTPLATSVQLSMDGSIRLAPDKPWMPLQAKEILSTQGFVWTAKAGQGIMQMHGADYYAKGAGRMRFSLWGFIPVVNDRSLNVVRSGIGRWVGEYFWLPSALLPQCGVHWQAMDKNTIQASLKADSETITLTFEIDEKGKLLRGYLPRWGNQTEDGHFAEIPFGGEYQAEQTFAGYTIPSQMGAGWRIGTDGYFEFIRTTLRKADFF